MSIANGHINRNKVVPKTLHLKLNDSAGAAASFLLSHWLTRTLKRSCFRTHFIILSVMRLSWKLLPRVTDTSLMTDQAIKNGNNFCWIWHALQHMFHGRIVGRELQRKRPSSIL